MTITAVTAGALIDPVWGNSVADALNLQINRPSWKLSRSVAFSVPNGVETAVAWDVEDIDTDGFHSGSGTTITVPAGLGGLYLVAYTIRMSSNSSGSSRSGRMSQAGSNFWGNDSAVPASEPEPTLHGSTLIRLSVAGTLDVRLFQNSGASLGTSSNAAAPGLCEFVGMRMGD